MGRCTFSSDDIVILPPNDRRLYRFIKLENGLSALLIHDPEVYPEGPPEDSESLERSEADAVEVEEKNEDGDDGAKGKTREYEEDLKKNEGEEEGGDGDGEFKRKPKVKGKGAAGKTKKAAAAMSVGVGSFSDPLEAQGLAHFLEHMLFMGSTEFPDENEYDSYLSKHGGFSNAHTEAERTIYHFEVKREFRKGALRRFSQFFVSPLVKIEAMEREVQAVDSEFNQVLQNDVCRLEQLQCHTAAPGHPFNKFFWGNKKSLLDAMENGINLHEQALKLYREYYHGGLMKLVVIGGESLDVLEDWVVEMYGNVEKGPKINLQFKAEGPIWKSGKLYRLEAVKDFHMLYLTWTLPSLHQEFFKKPDDYLAHLLGHEGRGSLLFYLRDRGWVTFLSAGVGVGAFHLSSVAYIFDVSLRLTDSGLEKMFDIIGFVYQYIKLLRQASPQEGIFRELQDIGNMEFRFAEEPTQDDYASGVAGNLQVYAAENVIYGDYVYKIWDVELINYVLGFFTPGNMRIDLLSKSSFKSEDFQCEPWFGSHYTEEDVSPSLMELWSDPPEIDVSLHLPSKNEFIPCDFSIHSGDSCPDPANISTPRCIIDEPLIKLWYKLDDTFKLPRVNTYFRINLKDGCANTKNGLLTELYICLLEDELNDILYQAYVANLEACLGTVADKMELAVCGFNDKLLALFSKILSTAKCFLPIDDRFKVVKEIMIRKLKNTNMNPLSYASYLRMQVLWQNFHDLEDRLHALEGLSISDLTSFIPELHSQVYVEGLCHGNLLEEEAISLSNIFKMTFSEPLPIELRHKHHIICLPPGANLIRNATVKNKSDTNSVAMLYYQIEHDVDTRMKVVIDLFYEIVWEPLFNQLRTTEQLGYTVDCSPNIMLRVYGFGFRVQSSEYNPIYLQDRMENFINGLEDLLEGLDDESFESHKNGLISEMLEKGISLTHETCRYWAHIIDKRYEFELVKKEVEELRSVHKKDVIDWYKTFLQQSSPKCRRLAVHVWGSRTDPKEAETPPESLQVIDDPATFKMSCSSYPNLR